MHDFASFDQFYERYLAFHRNAWNRRVHLLGWVLGLAIVVVALWSGHPAWALLGPACGLGAIWLGHGLIEPGADIEFKYPFWTALANLRMFGEMALGRLPR